MPKKLRLLGVWSIRNVCFHTTTNKFYLVTGIWIHILKIYSLKCKIYCNLVQHDSNVKVNLLSISGSTYTHSENSCSCIIHPCSSLQQREQQVVFVCNVFWWDWCSLFSVFISRDRKYNMFIFCVRIRARPSILLIFLDHCCDVEKVPYVFLSLCCLATKHLKINTAAEKAVFIPLCVFLSIKWRKRYK